MEVTNDREISAQVNLRQVQKEPITRIVLPTSDETPERKHAPGSRLGLVHDTGSTSGIVGAPRPCANSAKRSRSSQIDGGITPRETAGNPSMALERPSPGFFDTGSVAFGRGEHFALHSSWIAADSRPAGRAPRRRAILETISRQ